MKGENTTSETEFNPSPQNWAVSQQSPHSYQYEEEIETRPNGIEDRLCRSGRGLIFSISNRFFARIKRHIL